MSDTAQTLTPDYTAQEQDALDQAARLRTVLTQGIKRMALAQRVTEAGQASAKGVDIQAEMRKVKAEIDNAVPASALVGDSSPIDVSIHDLLDDYWTQALKRKNTATTGFGRLDDILSGGIEARRLVCVLGAPNTGKTTFTHQVSDHVANSGRPVLYVTSEDSPSALLGKTLARIGGVSYTAVLKGWESEKPRINDALRKQRDRASSDRLRYLDATNGVTMEMIRDKARDHFARFTEENGGGPGVLVIDYLQRIARTIKAKSGLSQDLREVVTMVTEQLRALSYELDCGVIAIASQSRAGYGRDSNNGAMASAKESGDIEYTCDVLMALTEDKDKDRATPADMTAILLNVDKNRQGQRGKSVKLDFWPDRQQFTEAAEY